MPPGISGLLIAAIFAGSMSSLDSSLNSVSTVCVTDFYQRFINPKSSDKQRLFLAKGITVVMGVFATITAILVAQSLSGDSDQKSSWTLFTSIQGLLGGTLAGIFCVGIFTRKANQIGVVAGLVISTAVLAIVKYECEWHPQTFAATGIVVAFGVTYLFSCLTPNKDTNSHLCKD